MRTAYISMGSNIKPRQNLPKVLRLLSERQIIAGLSTVYRTSPELNKDQPDYYNCVAAIRTDLGPKELKYNLLRKIERLLGRKRKKNKYASRTIDLDLIVYGSRRLKRAGMTLPDPEIWQRPYLAAGLKELGYRIRKKLGGEYEMGLHAKDYNRMKPLPGYTKYLRKELVKWNRIYRESKI